MKVTLRFRILEAFARVAVLDILLVLGLYILRNRGWRTWFDGAIGCAVVFYLNGRIIHNAFAKAFPNRKLFNPYDDIDVLNLKLGVK